MLRNFAIGFVLVTTGCASVSADARMDAELNGRGQAIETDAKPKDQPADRDRPLTQTETDRARVASLDTQPVSEPVALFGARHDFKVSDGTGAVSCKCVAALLGPPSSGKLIWQSEMPRTKPETQLMIALVPQQGDCGEHGIASYWGYRIEGNDVVVLVEDWKAGRPQTLGAIIPRPPANGQVYLAATSQKLPFGAVDGGARCPLGNPGPKRTEAWGSTENMPSSSINQASEAD
jgi:hypothetical protein